jgi:2-oxoglutarate dehydrogenase E2 component (dihydrolipoamide succinyltransferase)
MKNEIVVPEMGESISKGVIVEWLKKTGDFVKEGEPLFELETDKATVAVPSTYTGIVEIVAPKDAEVSINQAVAFVDTDAKTALIAQAPQAKVSGPEAALPLSPAVRRIVTENHLEPSGIAGSGKAGRITKADALAASEPSPAPAPSPALKAVATPLQPSPSLDKAGQDQTRVKMTPIRKRTAERLILASQQSVLVTTFNEIDMSKVMEIRSHHQEAFEKEHGIKIGYMSFFVKACCKGLAAHRELNAEIDKDEIVYNNSYNIGVAISIAQGLIVPVIRRANVLTFAGIETAVADFARRAREKQLRPEDLTGGTFSITNGGVFGSLMSTPVPAYPQSAIFGMHTIRKRPVVVDDAVVIRPMMYVALTYDHRIVDGRDAIGFLIKVKDFIEQPDTLLLEM